ncbi:hypothetical protein [Archangium lansingense]|uniref:Uncharacterized protein n=1 Tax=Archangium lansingense TaxID=2995310 RepID=A0ABT4ANT7_9BACT|nr:hypothetical protein [Archangium lansinium]MCY1083370.1 hypothetical protein [Archangium lansinium]
MEAEESGHPVPDGHEGEDGQQVREEQPRGAERLDERRDEQHHERDDHRHADDLAEAVVVPLADHHVQVMVDELLEHGTILSVAQVVEGVDEDADAAAPEALGHLVFRAGEHLDGPARELLEPLHPGGDALLVGELEGQLRIEGAAHLGGDMGEPAPVHRLEADEDPGLGVRQHLVEQGEERVVDMGQVGPLGQLHHEVEELVDLGPEEPGEPGLPRELEDRLPVHGVSLLFSRERCPGRGRCALGSGARSAGRRGRCRGRCLGEGVREGVKGLVQVYCLLRIV